MCRAIYDYDAQDTDELNIREGEVIEIINKGLYVPLSIRLHYVSQYKVQLHCSFPLQKKISESGHIPLFQYFSTKPRLTENHGSRT